MNRIKNTIKKSLLSLTLVGLVGQQAHGLGGRQHVGNFLSTASLAVAMFAPTIYAGLENYFSVTYPDIEPENLPRKKFMAGIFGVAAGLKVASYMVKSESNKNVADIKPSRLTYAGNALKCVFPGLLAVGSIYAYNTIYGEQLANFGIPGNLKKAGIHALALTSGFFLTNMLANKLIESGARTNVVSTIKKGKL